MKKIDILLIYPRLGSFDNLIRDIPLSLIYAATDSVKNGCNVKILDCRLYPDNWRQEIDENMKQGCSLVGLSVMTGNPINTSLEVSKYIKNNYDVPIVWGGPHPTILPEQTLRNSYIDYVIRDWGSLPLSQLIAYVKAKSIRVDDIVGLGYKRNGEIILNQETLRFELLDYRDIPYHLIEIDATKYCRLKGNELFFPIFTAIGCPYKCTYCMSPKVYNKIKGKKWLAFSVDSVLDHIDYLMNKYNFQRLQVYDDDTFVNLERMKDFFLKYINRGYNKRFKLDFRGARINELDKMDDEYLLLMVEANVEILAIGVESGSDKTLKRMNKGIVVEQILRVNNKLKKYPSLKPHYNIFCGTPGEEYEDLIKTKELMIKLANDNPSCMIGIAADWKPMPGTVMTEAAQKEYNLKLPKSLEEWAKIDSIDADKIRHPWYSKKIDNFIKLLQISGFLLDKKLENFEYELSANKRYKFIKLLVVLAKKYRPVLRMRLKYNFTDFLIEYHTKNFLMYLFNKMAKN